MLHTINSFKDMYCNVHLTTKLYKINLLDGYDIYKIILEMIYNFWALSQLALSMQGVMFLHLRTTLSFLNRKVTRRNNLGTK